MKNSDNKSNKMCRLCMNVNNKSINIFDKKGIKLNIAEILTKHFWFQVIENDGLSKVICTKCWSNTEEFHKFYNQIEITQNKLENITIKTDDGIDLENEMVASKHYLLNDQNNELDMNLTSIKLENYNIVMETKENNSCESLIEENSIGNISAEKNSACEAITRNALENITPVIKDEETFVEPDVRNIISSQDDDINDNNSNKCLKQLKRRKRNDSDVIIKKRKYSKRIPILQSKPVDEELSTDDSKKIDKDAAKQQIKNNKIIAVEKKIQRQAEDAQIREYFKMECNVCNCKFLTLLEVKSHYRELHQIKGHILCCDRKFYRRGAILEHIMRHLHPEQYKCELCNKLFAKKQYLKNHINSTHIPSDEKPFKCKVCPKCFTKQAELNYHVKNRHYSEEDKKFCCDDCGKSFMSKYILTQHIKNVHQLGNIHICDICGKVFKNKFFMELHRKSHLPSDAQPKIQCNICGIWVKHKHNLQKHLLLHSDTVKICPECGKNSPNRHALKNHIRKVHTNRSHVCTLCNKSYKQLIGLKEHMASHTGQTLYTCPHCPKTFNSGGNMHSHRKKVHPIEWEANRLKRFMS